MRKGLTLVELIVVISIIAVLVAILVPVLFLCGGLKDSTVCQGNLGVMGRKYNDYANDRGNRATPFPGHIRDGDAHDSSPTGLRAGSTFDGNPVTGIGTCGMQTVWVMISRGDLADTAFKCPADGDWTSRQGDNKYGWSALTEFSYGIHYPYASDGGAEPVANPADLNAKRATGSRRLAYRENLVLFADRNPGGAVDGTTFAHTNHSGSDAGCITVTRAGNTRFYNSVTDSRAGLGDDIYTDEGNTASPIPDSISDTVITPQISR